MSTTKKINKKIFKGKEAKILENISKGGQIKQSNDNEIDPLLPSRDE